MTTARARKCLLRTGVALLVCLPLLLHTRPGSSAEEAPTQPAGLHRWGAVTLFHGLPSDQVRAVAQDAEGVMWFGTDAGLARYDGRRVQSVTSEGLAGPRVRALAVGPDGALWVGADSGAFVRPPGSQEFRRVEETRGRVVLAVAAEPGPGRALLSTADGLVYGCALGADGLLVVNSISKQLTAASGKTQPVELSGVALIGDTVVVGTRGRGLMTIERGGGGAPRDEAREVAARPRAFYVEALARDSSGALFFGAQTSNADSGLFRVEVAADKSEAAGDRPEVVLRPSKVAGLATGKVTALAAAPGGELYAGTEARGVFRLKGGRVVERFTFSGTAGGLRSDTVNAIFVDREGVVWFGTPRGVCRYDPRGVRVEQLSEVSESNFFRTLYRTP
ncbi:MAG TPA: two-component regulator propeller domain-containing protein, partial [Pyrinomonadaceae bacterium]